MQTSKIFRHCRLALIIIISIISACQTKQSKTQVAVASDTTKPVVSAQTKLVVCYFHGNIRCPSCIALENYTKSEVEAGFADEIKDGKIKWKVINYDEKGNEHYMDDYKLYAQSVVISTITDGKETSWKNLPRVWQLLQDEGMFRKYIRSEVTACLAGKCL